MRKLWIAGLALTASAGAFAQTTIYKHVDAVGRVTYSNKPIKDGVVVDLEPLTTIPSTPAGSLVARPGPQAAHVPAAAPEKSEIKPAVALITPTSASASASFPSVDSRTQKSRDEGRRRILVEELDREEKALEDVRKLVIDEQRNPILIAAVRLAQTTVDPTPTQQVELRKNIDKASGRIRGLQATASEHEKNIEALKKELGALKP